MSPATQVVVTVLGAVVVIAVLRDIFKTLWHPTGQGRLATTVMRATWSAARRARRPGVRELSGPAGMVLILLGWTVAAAAGWFLVYLPHVPGGLAYDSSLEPASRSSVLDAAYLSLVTLGTLGYGDLVPVEPWLQVVAPLQALTGFVLLTAAVSWVLQVYPALARRRALAPRLTGMQRARVDERLHDLDDGVATQLLYPVGDELARVRVDLAQHPESYYFRDAHEDACLALAAGYLHRLSAAARGARHGGTQLAGQLLEESVDEFGDALLRFRLLRGGAVARAGDGGPGTVDVLRAYAADHGRGTQAAPNR